VAVLHRRTSLFRLPDPSEQAEGSARVKRYGHARHPTRSPATSPASRAARHRGRNYHVTSLRAGLIVVAGLLAFTRAAPALAQARLPLATAARLAAARAPKVDVGTLLAFASYESRLRPFAVHDNTTGQSVFPASAAAAIGLASTLLALGHSLDLGIMQVNSANFARTGLTVTTAFDPGESMRAGAAILIAAYRQCLRGNLDAGPAEQQAALRRAASIYNTGREQAGILNGYQPGVWRAAERIVPAIQFRCRNGPAASGRARGHGGAGTAPCFARSGGRAARHIARAERQ
jgi:type IV secretion system protein VirB1